MLLIAVWVTYPLETYMVRMYFVALSPVSLCFDLMEA